MSKHIAEVHQGEREGGMIPGMMGAGHASGGEPGTRTYIVRRKKEEGK